MGLDKANIFKLDDEEQAKYKKDPFLDCFESTKNFAKALMQDVETKETPHSLLLSADYGMGKTFFSTRFTQYLRKNHYDVIYFSVWENDYMNEPFLAFSKVIVNYINNKFQYEKYKESMKNLFEGIEKVVSSISMSFGDGIISISAKELLDNFKGRDPIVNFRKQLTSFIQKIPKQKLVIIVDELDRWRPDYAMKTLECIKHFFDIEGLFIIIPTNKNALNDCIKSLYGIEEKGRTNCEKYSQKFFNDERSIKKPSEEDYLHVVNQYLTKERLKDSFDKHLISESSEQFNSYDNLQTFFAKYSHQAGLTIRELKDYSMEIARICNNFYEPIRIEYLVYLMAFKEKNIDNCFLDKEHCYYHERYISIENTDNGKKKIMLMNVFHNEIRKIKDINYFFNDNHRYIDSAKYYNFIRTCNTENRGINNYIELNSYITSLEEKLSSLEVFYCNCSQVKNNLNIIKNALKQQKVTIKNYYIKFGSDDNDNSRMHKYNKIINNAEFLYSTTVE